MSSSFVLSYIETSLGSQKIAFTTNFLNFVFKIFVVDIWCNISTSTILIPSHPHHQFLYFLLEANNQHLATGFSFVAIFGATWPSSSKLCYIPLPCSYNISQSPVNSVFGEKLIMFILSILHQSSCLPVDVKPPASNIVILLVKW